MKPLPVSRYLTNLLIKLVLFTIVLALLVPGGTGGRYTFGGVLWLAVGLTLLTYFASDLWVLSNYGNWTAVFADAGLVVLGLWALPVVLGTPGIPFSTMVMTALLLGVGEFYFHRYLQVDLLMTAPAGGDGGEDGQASGRGGPFGDEPQGRDEA